MKKRVFFQEKIAAFRDASKRNALKVTHQRMEIFKELALSNKHPDAMTVFLNIRKRIPSLSFDTVYRTLRIFEEKGLINLVGIWGGRQRFDSNEEKHHHFVCIECGQIIDIYDTELDNLIIPRAAYKAGSPALIHVEVRGTCYKCKEKSNIGRKLKTIKKDIRA